MSKRWSIACLITVLLTSVTLPLSEATAGTCSGKTCQTTRLEFTPGQRITIQVINQTASLVELQKVYGTDALPLRPGQQVEFDLGGGTEPNVSVLFWDVTALPLRSRLSKLNERTLRIELRPGYTPPGDRAVYIRDDGRVIAY
ncbi:MAG: hypothetical protein KME16_16775 [Scytolyngbya sp. HA4215-MV1]|jgi:hypothetical protein|nr:hypothetical protein [Scytolyngbya sp. HA4215-MV1]